MCPFCYLISAVYSPLFLFTESSLFRIGGTEKRAQVYSPSYPLGLSSCTRPPVNAIFFTDNQRQRQGLEGSRGVPQHPLQLDLLRAHGHLRRLHPRHPQPRRPFQSIDGSDRHSGSGMSAIKALRGAVDGVWRACAQGQTWLRRQQEPKPNGRTMGLGAELGE